MNCEKVSNHIVSWMKSYAEKAGLKGWVVGVSGGVDSALVSTLCAKTGMPTVLVEMPINRTMGPISDRAEAHCDWLIGTSENVTAHYVDLSTSFNAFEEEMKAAGLPMCELAASNSRSRHRMKALYAAANSSGYSVVGTGNKVEDYGVGFFTKYGDGGIDLSPIGDLMKSEVRELARFLGVSEEIVKATPTDELWADTRSDEDQIGASYDELEWAMGHEEAFKEIGPDMAYGMTPTDRQLEVLRIYNDRHKKNAHKMKMPEVCIIPLEVRMAA